jgi:hypothetical protein
VTDYCSPWGVTEFILLDIGLSSKEPAEVSLRQAYREGYPPLSLLRRLPPLEVSAVSGALVSGAMITKLTRGKTQALIRRQP